MSFDTQQASAERGLIAQVMHQPDLIDLIDSQCSGIGGPDSLFLPTDRLAIWSAVKAMAAKGEEPDIIRIAQQCHGIPQVEALLAECYGVPTVSENHARWYVEELKNLLLRRQIAQEASRALSAVSEPDADPKALSGNLEAKFAALRDSHDGAVRLQTVRAAILERQDHWNALHEMHTKGIPTTEVATGWKWLDQMTGGLQPGYWVWCARPSAGKTTALVQLVDRASQVGPVAVFSLEMTSGQLIDRWAASYGVEGERFRDGAFSQLDFRSIHRMAQDVHGRPVYMDDRPTLTAGEICAICRMLWRKHGKLSGVFVDYLQITAPADKEERRDKRMKIENASAAFKTLSKQIGCPVVVAAQLGRPKRGERAEPSYSDIEWCGTVEQNADFIILKWRIGSAGETKLPCGDLAGLPDGCDPIAWKLAKQRNGRIGGRVMALDGKHFRFEQFSASHQPKTDDEW